jgi:hypothetical protein
MTIKSKTLGRFPHDNRGSVPKVSARPVDPKALAELEKLTHEADSGLVMVPRDGAEDDSEA